MANTKSAEKRNRQALKRRARNTTVRTTVKTAVKQAREAVAAKDPQKLAEAVAAATKQLGKAASKGVMHKRTVSRRISRLAKAANAAKAAK
ncbi:30S ribosomal protein S20 [Aggregicoccus sp. 17bor-14]|uniref:30S ribosomal protein S20 n=1 Tax=Myxococcaceae TaxID=31 RepID=UPI00129CDEF6|nr:MULTISPECIES: 30S ribosomal protein S20 [Myxococcaceae]MBF5046344.1 30S ribosomal protein S20 [Simulacricoccus sp. 17bor-14]MRI92064.1 30S ribosomal protein S20 [Aggregicoccus sp. 17bor-14]